MPFSLEQFYDVGGASRLHCSSLSMKLTPKFFRPLPRLGISAPPAAIHQELQRDRGLIIRSRVFCWATCHDRPSIWAPGLVRQDWWARLSGARLISCAGSIQRQCQRALLEKLCLRWGLGQGGRRLTPKSSRWTSADDRMCSVRTPYGQGGGRLVSVLFAQQHFSFPSGMKVMKSGCADYRIFLC